MSRLKKKDYQTDGGKVCDSKDTGKSILSDHGFQINAGKRYWQQLNAQVVQIFIIHKV